MSLKYNATGVMSGTSCDGLDMAHVRFENIDGIWTFELTQTASIPYSAELSKKLHDAFFADRDSLFELDQEFSHFLSEEINGFHNKHHIKASLIASHGHTIFHKPFHGGYSLQIGSGSLIAALTGIDTVTDFRNTDISLGGQGAPLVPVGDHLLFPDYDYCLNLGGIANISYVDEGNRVAFDICPVNMALNDLARQNGASYDAGGNWASKGNINKSLLEVLEKQEYYHRSGPKSLGREWYESIFRSEIDSFDISVNDKLATICEHIAIRISASLNKVGNMLITGGGTYNSFLLDRIKEHTLAVKVTLVVPDKSIIDFKEALIFAFLGILRNLNQVNTFASVTGASKDSIGGAIYAGN